MRSFAAALTFFLMILFPCMLFSQGTILYPGVTGQALLSKLVQDYRPATVQSYSNARDILFGEIYNESNYVSCVYTGYTAYLNPANDPSDEALAQGLNTEHSWPRSKGASEGTNGYSDMHHLYPAEEQVNSDRGNAPFNEIPDAETDRWYRLGNIQTTIPVSNIDEYSEMDFDSYQFEPREDHKGNLARAMFYFYTMYKAEADAADPNFFASQKDVLYRWHQTDVVDAKESDRNQLIANYQDGKVNPFIVDTTLVRRAYFTETPVEPGVLIISELMINPGASADADGEWVELYNPTENPVNINGWQLRDDDSDSHLISSGSSLEVPANGFVVLGVNSDYNVNGHVNIDYEYSGFVLGNSGDEVVLEKPDGSGGWEEVDRVVYDPSAGWPVLSGQSMTYTGSASNDNNVSSNWAAATEAWPNSAGDKGSPGYNGSDQSLPVQLISFSAASTPAGVQLSWTTESEVNNAGFEIYRSVDPSANFILLAGFKETPSLRGQGNSSRKHAYNYTDALVKNKQKYYYKLADVSYSGKRSYYGPISVNTGGESQRAAILPADFRLYPNYPNPFNPSTTIHFEIAEECKVIFEVYDITGQRIDAVNLGRKSPGEYRFQWSYRHTTNSQTQSGLYMYRLTAGSIRMAGKMLYIK